MNQPSDTNDVPEQLSAPPSDALYPEENPESGLSLAAVSAFHPAANIFPLLTEAELATLAQDIKANGLMQPVVRYRGQIIDGRNRFLACQLAEVEPSYTEWQGEGSPVSWVLSMNLRRRQLTDQQRAMVAARAKAAFLEEKPAVEKPSKKKESDSGEPSKKELKKATMKAAEMLGVSKGNVERASVVVDKGEESLVKVTSEGKVPLNAAVLVAALPRDEQKKIVEAGEVKAVAKRLREEKKAHKKAEAPPEEEAAEVQSSITVDLYQEGDALMGRAVIAGAELELTIRDLTAVLRFIK
jgi:hypothetical protein